MLYVAEFIRLCFAIGKVLDYQGAIAVSSNHTTDGVAALHKCREIAICKSNITGDIAYKTTYIGVVVRVD